MNQKNFKKIFTLYFILFGIIISLFGGFVGYKIQLTTMNEDIASQANEVMLLKKFTILNSTMQKMDDIVTTLATNPTIQDFISFKNEVKRKELENIFLAVAGVESQIMQARYIDENGMEVIRVDRTTEQNRPFIVEHSKLQNKSTRDYFQTLSKMQTETIWHSKFDLNIENGKIEIPYKPTIRVAMPIFKENKFAGTVIVNLLVQQLFNKITTSAEFDSYIIDKEGHYIIHPDEKYSFNKYTGISRILTDDFTADASKILAANNTARNCYIYPLNDIINNSDKAVLVLKPKETYKNSLLKSKVESTVIVIVLSIIASFFMAFFASINPSKLQKALIIANKELKKFTDIIDKYVITANTQIDSTITDASHAFEVGSGYFKSELIGSKMNKLRHPKTDESIYKELWNTILQGKEWSGEIRNRKKDGSDLWLEQHIIPVKDEATNEVESFLYIGVDITAKKELEELSSIDKLTGIYNRRKLDEFIHFEVELAKRNSSNFSVIIIDIDYFKKVNDTYGHQTGDAVLADTAKLITDNIRKSDIFGRYGGEEFVLVCPNTTKEQAFTLAEKLRLAVAEHIFEEVGQKTISLGIADLGKEDDETSIIKKADKALYEAKETGRNKAVIYHT